MSCQVRVFVAALLLVLAAPSAAPAQDLRIFETHLHYSQDSWGSYTPGAILEILDRAGVGRALVSSTPDDGTLKLYERAPTRIVPILRPYRSRGDMGTWYQDPAVLAYVEERLQKGIYKGIGEFHLSGGQTGTPVIRRLVELAVQKNLILHAHSDDRTVEELFALNPAVKILWAHAGMSAGPDVVGKLLDRYPNLWVELALRTDVAPGGQLDPAWRALFLRHPQRFMVGTDTWTASRWDVLPGYLDDVRAWLRQLPRDVAEQMASRNAARLFGP
ncbi:MAG: amidohydrolase family protein [Candidatus Rokubacteria bacterium]|nr:amidohydrolase family protein [Candidatus Rokubacteria bacterium]